MGQPRAKLYTVKMTNLIYLCFADMYPSSLKKNGGKESLPNQGNDALLCQVHPVHQLLQSIQVIALLSSRTLHTFRTLITSRALLCFKNLNAGYNGDLLSSNLYHRLVSRVIQPCLKLLEESPGQVKKMGTCQEWTESTAS